MKNFFFYYCAVEMFIKLKKPSRFNWKCFFSNEQLLIIS